MRGEPQFGLGDPADQTAGEGGRVQVVQRGADRPGEGRAEGGLGRGAVEDPGAGLVQLEGLGEQVGEVVHLDAALAEDVGEHVVLLAGALGPQHLIEEQVVLVGRGEAEQFQVGAVQQDLPQPPDLGGDGEHGCPYSQAARAGGSGSPAGTAWTAGRCSRYFSQA